MWRNSSGRWIKAKKMQFVSPVLTKLATEDRLPNGALKLNYLRTQFGLISKLENVSWIRVKFNTQMKFCSRFSTTPLAFSNAYPPVEKNHRLPFTPFRAYFQLKFSNLLPSTTMGSLLWCKNNYLKTRVWSEETPRCQQCFQIGLFEVKASFLS